MRLPVSISRSGRGRPAFISSKTSTLNIGSGEAIGLVGPSGSGKSTLLMVMAGLERADTGSVTVAGEDLSALDEDALARFRGRHVGIVFQSFHLIPTMTALENVAVPLELAGIADAQERARDELIAVGLGERLHHYPAELSGGEQQRVAVARALAPNPAIVVADEPTGNLDEDTGKQIIDLLFAGHAKRGSTLVLVTHDSALATALRADRAAALRPHRRRERAMSVATITSAPRKRPLAAAALCAARNARRPARLLRLHRLHRARLHGDRRRRLAGGQPGRRAGAPRPGHPRRRPAFTLIQREATPAERAFLDNHGKVSSAATMRAMARTADGKATLVEMKAVDGAYPLFGEAVLDPPDALADALAQRDGVFGAAADPILLTRLDIKPGARLTIGNANFEIRAALTSEPDKLAGGIGFGPRLLVSQDALRATGLLQPGSLVRWHYRLRLPANDTSDAAAKAVTAQARAQFPEAGWDIRNRSNASPQLERNVERFTQFLTIVGLTALLVGGVGVGNAVKSHLDRRREIIATMKALGASGRRVFAVYLTQVLLLAAGRRRHRHGARRTAAVPDFVDVRRDHSAADRAGAASSRAGAGAGLRTDDGARLRALAARPRP